MIGVHQRLSSSSRPRSFFVLSSKCKISPVGVFLRNDQSAVVSTCSASSKSSSAPSSSIMGRCTLSLFTSWERAVITPVHVTAVPLLAAGGSTCRGQIFNVRDAGVVAVTRCCSNVFSLSREVLFSVHVACFCPQTRKREASLGRLCSVCIWSVSVLRHEREACPGRFCSVCMWSVSVLRHERERHRVRLKRAFSGVLIKNEQQKVHCQRSEKKIKTNKQTNGSKEHFLKNGPIQNSFNIFGTDSFG